ncbi:MAG: 16S rRNA processing protein RimM [Spirochaetales bacterium]|nr:16S rRNA processing protein RimM [Spirochaetales bacterium]
MVLGSFGTRGFFKAKSFSGETKHFFEFNKVYFLKDKRYETFLIEKIRETPKALLIKVEGIDSPEEIKKYIRCEIWVEKKYASPLHTGEYYISDLCQCNVFFNGKIVGQVKAVCESAQADLFEVKLENNNIIIIPFLDHFVETIDIKSKSIYLREDCGLL